MAIQQNILSNLILKKYLRKKIYNFLKILGKKSKKKRLINIFKQNLSIDKPKQKTHIINILNNFDKKNL